jgi:hypothetical protein
MEQKQCGISGTENVDELQLIIDNMGCEVQLIRIHQAVRLICMGGMVRAIPRNSPLLQPVPTQYWRALRNTITAADGIVAGPVIGSWLQLLRRNGEAWALSVTTLSGKVPAETTINHRKRYRFDIACDPFRCRLCWQVGSHSVYFDELG